MAKVYCFCADGTEPVELLGPADVLRRAGEEVTIVSIMGRKTVTTSHEMVLTCDALFEEVDLSDADLLFVPGGMPGTIHMEEHAGLREALVKAAKDGKTRIAAICAAPRLLGDLGILEGKQATCFPGNEGRLKGATYLPAGVVQSGLVTTARGMGYSVELGLRLLGQLQGPEAERAMRTKIQNPA